MSTYDIIIVGGGIVGGTIALTLAKKTPLQIALLDSRKLSATWQATPRSHRVSAISLASQKIFQNLGIWQSILSKRISPYQKMQVWDSMGDGKLHFDSADLHLNALGFIIEDEVIRTSLLESLSGLPNVHLLSEQQLISLNEKSDGIELTISDNITHQAKLFIAADGGDSWVRAQAGIEIKNKSYEHTAIVTTVKTERENQATAWQRFLPTGPLAFLPLSEPHTSSIVWSTSPAQAEELLALSDADFQQALAEAFAFQLGDIISIEERYTFPLKMRHAKNYIKPHLALVGDAAHTIHPLAGQGVNMGLLDAACLADVIITARAKQRDYSSYATLRRYERERKADNVTLLAFVEGIKQLFASPIKPIKILRNLGLNATDQLSFVKNFFTNYAIGNRIE